jgi:hypothetical protein
MKNIIAVFVLLAIVQQLAAQALASIHNSIPAKDAKNHVGEEMVVTGTISEIYINKDTKNVYLYLDGDIEHAQFAAVWPGTNDPPSVKVFENLIAKLEPISVSGKITVEKHLPEIIVSSWSQIN